ncbi:hypothetical protein [Bacteriovorax sp. Seq25_V]|uniref:hypothetical protein n=1 Tax=Bacteriovorax sp. Seq25_V TaxID=1201288 RepID=UPI00038A2ACE|nr:hypothetical protein [Bacteriovorax sp. Seq25_V]EQC45993.1 hypothetical protein M900_1588 [Bacteriovorax sp. Seq25_V]
MRTTLGLKDHLKIEFLSFRRLIIDLIFSFFALNFLLLRYLWRTAYGSKLDARPRIEDPVVEGHISVNELLWD